MTARIQRLPGWLLDIAVLVVGLVVFVILAAHQLNLPGLHTDEALEVLPAVQLLRGQEVECFKDVCIEVLGVRLPVMIYEYIATVNTCMVLPFFAAFGINVPALRAMPIVQSAGAMIFVYLLARELYGRRAAIAGLLMLAVNPSFVFWSRQGVFVTSVTILISMAGVWAWLRWWRTARRGYLYLGSFLFGLGISAKFLFGWLIAGVIGAFVLLNTDRIVQCVRQRSLDPLGIRLRWWDALIAAALFLTGLAPLIIFNVRTMSTINYIRANVGSSSYYQVDNTRIGENLRERIKELRSVLNGETFWYLAEHPYASWRYPSVFLIAVGTLAFSLFGSKQRTLRETLPRWIGVAAIVVPSYVALRFLPVHEPGWRVWLPIIAALSTALTGALIGRGWGWREWAQHAATGAVACALTMLYVYLAWKLAQWHISGRLYLFAIACLASAPLLRAREEGRKVLFPVLVIAVMLSASIFTPTALWFTHLAILTPWPILAIAAIADLVARRAGLDRINLPRLSALNGQPWASAVGLGTLAMLALAGMLIYDDLEVDIAYHRDLARLGGKGDHTHASYRLVKYLEENGITDVVAMDWGIQDVVQFLSAGEINPHEIFGYENHDDVDPTFGVRVREHLAHPSAVYVFRTQPHFRNREGRRVVELQTIYDWAAIPIYRLVRVT